MHVLKLFPSSCVLLSQSFTFAHITSLCVSHKMSFLWVARWYFQKSWNLISEEGITSFRGTRRKKFHKWNSLPWNRLKTFWWMVFFPNKTAKWRIKRLIFSCEKTWTEIKFDQKWSLQDQSAMKHLISCILITCNSENSAPKFPQNNNINTELKPHDNDDVAA